MDEIKACEKLDLKNEQTLRRIEEVRAEIAESRRKIEEFNQGNIFFKQRMDATDRETQAFQRQKGTSHLSMQLNQRAIELAKEKLARLTVSNAKMSKENTTCSLEWREHIEAGEKVLARTKALYKNAPWILDADSEKMSISAATKEAEKVWAALKTSFEAISDDGMPDEENFMQQMTIIRRLGNKIQRNNREWLKIFPKKPKRHSVVSMIDAGALLNDSLAELEEDLREDHVDENQNSVVNPLPRTPIPFKRKAEESRVSSFVKRAKLDEGDRPVQHVTFAEPIQEDFALEAKNVRFQAVARNSCP
ncbi:hypothetical protein L596_014184 [Steinernema carpocapsae]|uniref:Uncharacterized protein n=1 Tax=Steinernema carpocapsae TaxID=34508 RepID=A0A4U5NBZ3_STECR|nr:hypothetical protein L596_014184 [Steinernema carpocapsae]